MPKLMVSILLSLILSGVIFGSLFLGHSAKAQESQAPIESLEKSPVYFLVLTLSKKSFTPSIGETRGKLNFVINGIGGAPSNVLALTSLPLSSLDTHTLRIVVWNLAEGKRELVNVSRTEILLNTIFKRDIASISEENTPYMIDGSVEFEIGRDTPPGRYRMVLSFVITRSDGYFAFQDIEEYDVLPPPNILEHPLVSELIPPLATAAVGFVLGALHLPSVAKKKLRHKQLSQSE